MTATLDDIRGGIRDRLLTIPDLEVFDFVSPGVAYPCAVIGDPDIDYAGGTMGSGGLWTSRNDSRGLFWPVYLWVSAGFMAESKALLQTFLEYSGTNSIFGALRGDKTLGGVASDTVATARILTIDEWAAVQQWGAMFTLQILARHP